MQTTTLISGLALLLLILGVRSYVRQRRREDGGSGKNAPWT